MPTCPSCHQYYAGNPEKCPKCDVLLKEGKEDVLNIQISKTGENIKNISVLTFIVSAIVSIIVGIFLMISKLVFIGILVITVGIFLGFILNQVIYGYGVIVESSEIKANLAILTTGKRVNIDW